MKDEEARKLSSDVQTKDEAVNMLMGENSTLEEDLNEKNKTIVEFEANILSYSHFINTLNNAIDR